MPETYEVHLLVADIITTVQANNPEEAKEIAYLNFKARNPDIEIYDTNIGENY